MKYFTHESLENVQDILNVMRYQESTVYSRSDYMSKGIEVPVDAQWRQRIIEWMYGVIDHCQLRRDSVAIAAHYLDMLMERGVILSRDEFQIAAMTSLQLAIKLHDSTMVKLESMVKLGRGLFSEEDVENMERRILSSLNWQVNPPTSVCFLRQLLLLVPDSVPALSRYTIAEVTRFISEVSVCLYKFVKYRPSVVALAGMNIAMSRMDSQTLPFPLREQILEGLASALHLQVHDPELIDATEDLRRSLDRNIGLQELMNTIDSHCQEEHSKRVDASKAKQRCHTHSPRDVSRSMTN